MIAFWLFLIALAVGACLRLPQLDARPMHTDETTQAIKFRDLATGHYVYDPTEHHGPTLLYSTFPSNWFSGVQSFGDMKEENLRIVPVIYGLALILLLPLVASGTGWLSLAWAALLLAVSPIFVFYSRYYIMEMLLAFFSFTAIASGWRFYVNRNPFWLGVCGISFGLMHATKETFVIHVVGMIGAIVGVAILRNLGGGMGTLNRNKPTPIGKQHWITFFSLAIFTSIICFSQAFTHLESIVESVTTYTNYAGRAGGQGHEKPWTYYLQLLGFNQGGKFWTGETGGPFVWSELFILIFAVGGMMRSLFSSGGKTWNRDFMLFLSIYAVLTFGAYSFVAYKTPWCILSTHMALILLAGFGIGGLIESLFAIWGKWVCAGFLMIGVSHLALQSYRSNFKDDPTGPTWLRTRNTHSLLSNPYAYGFTPTSLRDSIVSKLESYAKASPNGHQLRLEIATASGSWPLPWYLRKFTSVAYLPNVEATTATRGVDPTADVILIDPAMIPKLPESVRGADYNGSTEYAKDLFGMLNQQYWIQGYVKRTLLPATQSAPAVPPAVIPPDPVPSPTPAPEPAPTTEPVPAATPLPPTEPAAPTPPATNAPTTPEAIGTPLPAPSESPAPSTPDSPAQ